MFGSGVQIHKMGKLSHMARKKKRDNEWNGEVTVLGSELAEVNRSTDRLMTMMQQSGKDEVIERTAFRVAAEAAERRRIKDINKFVDGRTLTELRMRGGPIATLINKHRIGGEEMMAIMDIELAITTIAGGLLFKPVSLELKSAGVKSDPSNKALDARRRYEAWANFWSKRAVNGDRTLAIVIAAVIDGRAFRAIEDDYSIRNGRAVMICIRGLRDYSARSGEVTSRLAHQWMEDALKSFKDRGPLSKAIAMHLAVRQQEQVA